jgi:hypothetical protein
VVAGEPVVVRSGEAVGEGPVAGAEQMDEHVRRLRDRGPRGRDARHVEGRERRHRGEGRQGRRGEPDRSAVGRSARHDRDAGGVPAERQLEGGEVVDDVRFHTTSQPCLRGRHSTVLAFPRGERP